MFVQSLDGRRPGVRGLRPVIILASIFCGSIVLIGCTADPKKYTGLQSAPELSLQKDGDNKFQYIAPDADFSKYNSAIVDPVEMYQGQDAQFGSTSENDRTYIARYINKVFPREIEKQYALVQSPGANTLRFHVTLTGLKKSIPVLSTISHVSSFGIVTNGLMQAAGQNGTAYGAVYYAVEIYDSQTSKLLYAHVTVQTPDALDPTVSFGYLDAAREGVRIGVHHLMTKLQKLAKQEQVTINEQTGSVGHPASSSQRETIEQKN